MYAPSKVLQYRIRKWHALVLLFIMISLPITNSFALPPRINIISFHQNLRNGDQGSNHDSKQTRISTNSQYFQLKSTARTLAEVETYLKDTDESLPSFFSREEYHRYLAETSGLPQGFQIGVASGQFQAVEAPNLGYLDIRATVISLIDGPSNTWAACFTKNKVSIFITYLV